MINQPFTNQTDNHHAQLLFLPLIFLICAVLIVQVETMQSNRKCIETA